MIHARTGYSPDIAVHPREVWMFAILAAVAFALALLLELIDEALGELVTPRTLALAGLLFLAVQLAPGRGRGRWRR